MKHIILFAILSLSASVSLAGDPNNAPGVKHLMSEFNGQNCQFKTERAENLLGNSQRQRDNSKTSQ